MNGCTVVDVVVPNEGPQMSPCIFITAVTMYPSLEKVALLLMLSCPMKGLRCLHVSLSQQSLCTPLLKSSNTVLYDSAFIYDNEGWNLSRYEEQTLCAAAPNMEYRSSCIPGSGAFTGYYQPGQLNPECCKEDSLKRLPHPEWSTKSGFPPSSCKQQWRDNLCKCLAPTFAPPYRRQLTYRSIFLPTSSCNILKNVPEECSWKTQFGLSSKNRQKSIEAPDISWKLFLFGG
ncbi:hypothetical protein LAZ67_14001012 [Cordylochernes scorpioides]|uniref:Uncharacterized protein n=1 Tax=Cordylochernes scorpioides TaxID=51811 RepID=A0ABY6LAP8_9ARAC|nr:hypothetical protein LAZ67_14001012 [Cordylochernes scorpioides]